MASDNPTLSTANNQINLNQGYGYDTAGNLISVPNKADPTKSYKYEYDAENRQISFDRDPTTLNTKDATYVYDGDGRRVVKVADGVKTVFVYDIGGKLVAEYATNGSSGGGTSYVTSDMLGTPRVITGNNINDASGGVKARHDYLPFGEELFVGRTSYTSDSVRQKFTGYERDNETGLDFAQARYYASTQGRFTSVDPLMASGKPEQPQSWNRYTYCLNNPLVYIDKNGEWPTETHHQFIADAFYGLSNSEISAIQMGSNYVDTYFGTGEWYDIPITLMISEAPKHAMTPGSMPWEEAHKEGMKWVTAKANEALEAQTLFESRGHKGMAWVALRAFGEGGHTYMDSTSPAHRGWQRYAVYFHEISTPFTGIPDIVPDYDRFLRELLEHKKIEARKPTQEERNETILLLRSYYLTTFGDRRFKQAVPKEEDRQPVYDYVKQHGGQYVQ